MYDQIREDTLYIMLYAGVTVMAMIACCYLLFRQGNAIAADITSPARLRRWTAAFFASVTWSHVWYVPIIFLTSSEDVKMVYLVGVFLDCITIFPLAVGVLFAMLQDCRRPLWPIGVMVAPLVVMMAWCVICRNNTLLSLVRVYLLLLSIGLIIYMVRAVRQYGRWLRDNYADLEHKEVWQSFMVLAIILLVFGIYTVADWGPIYQYVLQLNDIVLTCYLLWRVETLSDLSIPPQSQGLNNPTSSIDNIGPLLQQYCIDTQLYLQHDLTLLQLAKTIGTNRYYLSQYFSSQGMNYNAYINHLRIDHFVSLYREAVDAHRSITAQQLAHESGYRSYSTFSDAFKRQMGRPVTAWMRAQHEEQEMS